MIMDTPIPMKPVNPAAADGFTAMPTATMGHDHHHEDHDAHSHAHHHGDHVHSHDGHDHSHHHHHHSTMAGIASIIDGLDIPAPVKEDMKAVYALIAEAESHAHGMPVDQIHFHEVGTMDAVADIAAYASCSMTGSGSDHRLSGPCGKRICPLCPWDPSGPGSGHGPYFTGDPRIQHPGTGRALHPHRCGPLKAFCQRIPGNAGDDHVKDRIRNG